MECRATDRALTDPQTRAPQKPLERHGLATPYPSAGPPPPSAELQDPALSGLPHWPGLLPTLASNLALPLFSKALALPGISPTGHAGYVGHHTGLSGEALSSHNPHPGVGRRRKGLLSDLLCGALTAMDLKLGSATCLTSQPLGLGFLIYEWGIGAGPSCSGHSRILIPKGEHLPAAQHGGEAAPSPKKDGLWGGRRE